MIILQYLKLIKDYFLDKEFREFIKILDTLEIVLEDFDMAYSETIKHRPQYMDYNDKSTIRKLIVLYKFKERTKEVLSTLPKKAWDFSKLTLQKFLDVNTDSIRLKQLLLYKRIVNNRLKKSYKDLDNPYISEDKRNRSEQTIINLHTSKGSYILPRLDNEASVLFSIKSLLADRRFLVVFVIINLLYILFNNTLYYTEILLQSLFFIFFQLLLYKFIVTRRLKDEVVSNTKLYDFLWKHYSSILELEEDYKYAVGLMHHKEEEVAYNTNINEDNVVDEINYIGPSPSVDIWKNIFNQFYSKHDFVPPIYSKLENTELYIFTIPTMSVDDFLNKQEQIQNFVGKKIYKIYRNYNNTIGNIAIEFETSALPRIIPYTLVPSSKDNEIIIGKSIKDWISWNLDTSPHALVVGPTGGGKSVTMNFLISQVINKKWLPYFVDFKGGSEFGIYNDKKYSVITEREDFAEFSSLLIGEVEYRSRLNAKYKAKNLKSLNAKLINEGKEPLPRIVVFLDEYADVNSTKDDLSFNINSNIGRVLAKGRAVGIHLVIGTQRPDANTIGSGAFRDNIACRIVGKMSSESGYKMSFGVESLSKEDKNIVSKVPNDKSYKGIFILQGTGTTEDKEIVRVPFMEDEEFEVIVDGWNDNIFSGYKLHPLEAVEDNEDRPLKLEKENKNISPMDFM